MKTHMPMLRSDVAALGTSTAPPVHEHARRLHPGHGAAATPIESEDLARFEGEGGLEAREPGGPHPEEWSAQ